MLSKYKPTFFSLIFRIFSYLHSLVEKLESIFETTLIPKKCAKYLVLKRDYHEFFRQFYEAAFYAITRKKRVRSVIDDLPNNLTKRPLIVQMITWIGVVGGSAKVIFDVINHLSDRYDFEIITLSDYQLEFPYSRNERNP